jgi:multiple sugar transport system permease protein
MECARLDGASDFRIYWSIVIPLLKPCLGALAIFTFLANWNDFLNPLLFLERLEDMTLPLAIQFFDQHRVSNLSAVMAACALVMLPVTLVFLTLQKYFIKGISMTGMK